MAKYKIKKDKDTTSTVADSVAVYHRTRPVFSDYVIKNEYKLIRKAHEGLKTEVFYALADAIKMPEKTLASVINLSPRTISNYRGQQKSLDPTYSEHLLKLINLYDLGKEIFGSYDEFSLWLNRPFFNTTTKPADLITTPGGVDLVHEEIEKLAQGYPV